jgi:hypothetical protein
MTYLTTWLCIIFGVTIYEFAIRRQFDKSYCDALFWSGFALLLHQLLAS